MLRVAGDTKVSVFDLHQSTTNNNALSQGHMYDQLLRMNPSDGNKTIIPDLASSWEMSQDGLSYTYHLRPGVKFHDGSTMTADDVVATYNKIIFPGTGVLSPRKDMFAAVTKVEAVDPLTVRFVLKRPSAGAFTGTGTAWNVIVSKKTLEANKNNLKTVPDYPGTGPFRLVRFTVGEQIVSERNPDYWNKGLPYLDGVTTLEAGGGSAGAAAVFTGKAEYAGISYDLVPQAERSNGAFIVSSAYSGNPRTVFFNMKKPFFVDSRVRRAIHLVVNRQGMSDGLKAIGVLAPFGGPWVPAGGVWETPLSEVEKLPGYRPDKTADIAEAKRLMVAAGYPNGIKDLDILARGTSGQAPEIIGPGLLDQVSVLGITGKIRPSDSAAWPQEMARGGFDLGIGFVNMIVDDPSGTWAVWFGTGAGYNYGFYSNPKIDKLIEQLDTTTDFQQRLALVKQGNAILDEDPPMIFTGTWTLQAVFPSYLKGMNVVREGQGYYTNKISQYDGWNIKKDAIWLDK